MWTFVRHTVSRCLTFPTLPEVARSGGQVLANSRCRYINAWFAHLNKLRHVAFPQFLPTGQYGLCFGYCFSGPLPLRSHHGRVTLRGACFRESPVIRLYSEIGQTHLSIEAQCGTACLPMGDCHTNNSWLQDGSPVFKGLSAGWGQ